MGYLTDPTGFHGKPFRLIINHQGKICILLYVVSVVWYCLLSHDQINSATYLSENALLPGLVVVDYNEAALARTLKSELETETAKHSGIPAAWIKAKMAQIGLQVYSQNFTLNHPLRPGIKYTGNNVYGILLGGDASTESIVLAVPFRPPTSSFPPTNAGLALVLSIAHYFRRQKYWAKDIIFLFTEHEQLGTQAWLEAYHGVTCGTPGILDAGELEGRGGSIQAAINVEISNLESGGARYLDVKLLGLNGQLPNLDLYNLIHRICNKERVGHTFDKREKLSSSSTSSKYIESFLTMGSMVMGQASGVPDGNHGLYHRFGIEAVTVEGFRGTRGPALSYHQVGRVIEGVYRSINNLLERFHQSYFFFLLADYDRFISIGYYMVCIGTLAGALFIKAFSVCLHLNSIWVDQLFFDQTQSRKSNELKESDDSENKTKDLADAGQLAEESTDSKVETKESTNSQCQAKEFEGTNHQTKESIDLVEQTEGSKDIGEHVKDSNDGDKDKEETDNSKKDLKEISSAVLREYPNLNSVGTGVVIMLCYFLGLAVYSAPQIFVALLHFIPTEDAVLYGYTVATMISFTLPWIMSKRFGAGEPWYLLEMCLEVLLATLLIVVAMHNFSLAIVVGVFVTPAFLLLKSKNNGWLRRLAVWTCHPGIMLAGFILATVIYRQESLEKVLPGIKQALTLAVIDSHIYASNTLTLVTLFYLPNWTMACLLAYS